MQVLSIRMQLLGFGPTLETIVNQTGLLVSSVLRLVLFLVALDLRCSVDDEPRRIGCTRRET